MKKSTTNQKTKQVSLIVFILLGWAALILIGTHWILTYEYTPGADQDSPTLWPQASAIRPSTDSYTLVMTVHPKCNCSRASLGELSKLITKFPLQLDAKILFVAPKDFSHDIEQSKNWRVSREIRGAEVVLDNDGKIAQMFHAKTSGFTLVYNRDGKLVFSGGITSSRGHWGQNAGSDAITEIITKNISRLNTTAAFGCSLFNKTN